MHNFKRVLISSLFVILLFFTISAIMIIPFLNSEMCYYQDSKLRNSLENQLDFLVIGASNGLCAFDSKIIDKELNTNSYNLSGTLMTLGARDFLLRKEIERNPVKTVVFDVSYETLTRNEDDEDAGGDSVTFTKFTDVSEQIQFLKHTTNYNDLVNIYSNLFTSSIEYWMNVLKGYDVHNVDYSAKGYYERKVNNIELEEVDVKNKYDSEILDTDFRDENIEKLISQIKYCQSKNINVILVTVPKSNSDIWEKSHLDDYLNWMSEFSKENNCEFYDFNLLKNRYELWNDRNSFYDETHMSGDGASIFTKEFCKILKLSEREDVSKYFYDSYEDMKKDSPYMKYLK